MKLRLLILTIALASLGSACSGTGSALCCIKNTGSTNPNQHSITVLTLNLAHGRDDSLNQLLVGKQQTYRNLDDIADLLLQISPDVAAFQEADAPSGWSGNFSHVEYLADKTGWANYVHGQHADGWLYAFGTAILSRHHFSATRLHTFSPSFPTTTKGFVAATVDWQRNDEALALTVISVHLDFSRESVRQAQIEELIDYAATLTGPFVVAGDFNDEWNDDDSSIRELMERLKLKAFQPHAEHLGTYKSTDGKRLDWILLSEGLEFLTYNVVTEEISDHYAVVAEIMPNAR